MSTTASNLKKFADILKTKPTLQQQLKTVKDEKSFIALYVRIAKENGCELSLEEVRNSLQVMKSKKGKNELTQQDLHAVAAGVGDGCDPEFPRTCDR